MTYADHEYALALSDYDYLFCDYWECEDKNSERAWRIVDEARIVRANMIGWASRD